MARIVLAITLFFALANLSGQGLHIGVYTEPQITWINSDEANVAHDGSVVKFNSGIDFDIFFMPNYAFTIGLGLNNMGGKLLYYDTTRFSQTNSTLIIPAGFTAKHSLQYLNIPLGLKLKTTELGYTTFYFHGGLSPLLNLKAVTSSAQLSLVKENIKEEINLFSLNYFVSAGIEYRLAGNTALILGLKWSSGFNDVTINDFANNNLNSAGLHIGIRF
jgi:hypothetical protein